MSSTMLKLYESSGSPNSRRVRFFLAEKGICLSRVPVDLGAKEQVSEAYARINPRRVVPTLVLADGTAIGEVPAIQLYLEETHPNSPLLGSSAREKALVAMWDRRMEQEGFAIVMETVRNAAAGLKGRAIAGPHAYEQIPALVERGHQRLADFHADLEARLDETAFVAGERFSVADITAIVAIDFATKALNLPIPKSNAETWRWCDSVASRPSFDAYSRPSWQNHRLTARELSDSSFSRGQLVRLAPIAVRPHIAAFLESGRQEREAPKRLKPPAVDMEQRARFDPPVAGF